MSWQTIKEKQAARYVYILFGVTLIIVTTLLLLRVVSDPDFFWHLKTGEWIWQNMSLPSHDPLSYTTPSVVSARARFILTSYWLSQVIYHLVHSATGMSGVVFLRFLVIGALIYVMTKRKHGDHLLYLGLLLFFVTNFLQMFPADRPQVFSFLFFGVLLLLLDRIKHGISSGYYGLPVLMLIWGNMHGGYVMGQAIIAMYLVMEGLKFLRPGMLSPIAPEAYKKLLLAGAAGIACSFINPNTYNAWTVMMKLPSFMTAYSNIEYMSTIESLIRNNDYSILLYWFLLILTAFGLLVNIKKIDVTEAVLLAATGYFSFTQQRYIAFFLIAAIPTIGRLLSGNIVLPWARPIILAAAIFITMFFSRGEIDNIKNIVSGRWINESLFPVHASEFVSSNKLTGNMYNNFTWGGYLIWRLGPERKVFIDGRSMYDFTYAQSQLVDTANTSSIAGLPFWRSILASYNVRYIIIPFYHAHTGTMMPLVKALLRDKDWVPVFIYFNSVVFVKDTPDNRHVIAAARRSVKKEYFGESMLYMIDRQIKSILPNATLHIAKGDVYFDMYRVKEAKAEYEKAVEIAPFNATAKGRIRELNAWGK